MLNISDNKTNYDELIKQDNTQLSVSSLDRRNISSYGNGPLGLINEMETFLSPGEDGFLEKSRKTSLLTFGSERMDIIEASNLTGIDEMGNVYNYGWERNATLKDVSFPFAVMRDDLVKLSDQNLSVEGYYSKTFLLLPEGFESVYDLGTLNTTFGNLSQIEIKTYKYNYDALGIGFDMNNLSQLFGSGLSDETMELFGESLSLFYNMLKDPQMRQMMTDYQNRTREQTAADVYDPQILFKESMGGVTCIWGSVNA